MATGIGMGFSMPDDFFKRLDKADKALQKIAESSDKTDTSVRKLANEGFGVLVNKLDSLISILNKANNTKIGDLGLKKVATEATNSAAAVARFNELMGKINNVKGVRNSAVAKITEEIEIALKRLEELQSKLNFYGKGEGQKALGFLDAGTKTNLDAYQKEANQLMRIISLLERQKASLEANARLRLDSSKKQQDLDNAWYAMEREKQQRERQSAEIANRNAKQSIEAYIQSYNERYRAYEEMFKRIEQRERQLQSYMRSFRYSHAQRTGDTTKQATAAYNRLFSDKGNVSLNNMQSVLAKLSTAQRKLNLDTEEGRKKYEQLGAMIKRVEGRIKEVTGASDQLQKKHRSLLNTSEQLMRKLALVFSVSQIQGYIQKMVDVRGEFELQQRALQAILQNKDEADKLWQQTVDLAIRSPFRVGELVQYTKQLAAYRIETNKLHDTTKRLADVSAGLGVDMSRLILAFGQVRAASYLRGTELRQFTEAGIPMLEELAAHFTELEGKAVSVGDVFGRISKRMVAFSDVEEVFKQMTDAGGVFYDMQEIQAETLKGQISNLHDSIDLMLNDIGKANEDVLKGGVQVAKSFIENWREIADQITLLAKVFIAVKTSAFLFNKGMKLSTLSLLGFNIELDKSKVAIMKWEASAKLAELRAMGFGKGVAVLRKGIAMAKVAILGLKAAFLTMLPATALAGVYEIYRGLTAASRAAEELHKEMEQIDTGLSKELSESIALYGELTAKLKDNTISYNEREKALSALKRTFKDILPDQYLELENIKNLTTNYQDATNALKQYYEAKSRELKLSKIDEMFESELTGDINEFVEDFMGLELRGANKKLVKSLGIDERHLKTVLNSLTEDIKNGNVEVGKFQEEFIKRLNKMFGTDIDLSKLELTLSSLAYFNHEVSDITETLTRYRQEVDAVTGMSYDTIAGEKFAKEYEQQRIAYDKQTKKVGELRIAYSNLYRQIQQNREKGSAIEDKDIAKFNGYRKDVEKLYKDLKLGVPVWNDIEKATNNAWAFEDEIDRVTKSVNNKFVASLESAIKAGNKLSENFKEQIQQSTDALKDTDIQDFTREVFTAVSEQYKVPLSTFDKLKADGKQSLEDVKKNVEGEKKALRELREEYDKSKKTNQKTLTGQDLSDFLFKGFGITPEQRAELDNTIKALEEAEERLGGGGEDDKKQKTKNEKILSSRISLIKKIYTEYKKLEDEYGKEIATERIIKDFGDTFKEAFEGTKISLSEMFFKEDVFKELEEKGTIAGKAISESVKKELQELKNAGTYIRIFDDKFIERLKEYEGYRAEAYKDIKGVWTQGYGETIDIEKGKSWSKEHAEQVMRNSLTKRYVSQLNEVLDINKELVLTQEQYNALLDLSYQGGIDAVKNTLVRAKDVEQGVAFIQEIANKIKNTLGADSSNRFGEQFVRSFREAETIYERIALLLEATNLTAKGEITSWYEGMQRRSDERAGLFRGDLEVSKQLKQVMVELAKIDFTTPEGIVKALKMLTPIAKQEGEEAMLALSKEISGFEVEIGLELVQTQRKNLVDSIESMFGNYEMSLELEKLNIPPDLAKQLFNVDSIELPDIRKKVEEEMGKTSSKKTLEELGKLLKKVEEFERKAQEERLKEYVKYLEKASSEAVKIKLNELKQLAEIEQTFQLTEKVATSKDFGMDKEQWAYYKGLVDSKKEINNETLKEIGLNAELIDKIIEYNNQMRINAELAIRGVRKGSQEKMNENQWELFKESSPYKLAFSDLETQSIATLSVIEKGIKKIEDSLSKLDVSQMKELADLRQKVFDIKVSRNPFKELATSMKEIKSLKKQGLTRDNLLNQIVGSEETIAKAQHTIDLIDIAMQKDNRGADVLDAKDLVEYHSLLQKTPEQLQNIRTAQEGVIAKNKENKQTAEDNLNTYSKTEQAAKEAFAQAQQTTQQIQQAYGSIKETIDAMGVGFGDQEDAIAQIGWGLIDLGMQIAQIAIQARIMGVAFQTAMGPIGWISMAVSGVATILTGLFKAHDAGLEKQIQNLQNYVEDLDRAFQKLEKRIESAYSVGTIQTYNELAAQNLKKQMDATQNMIAMEEQKKKTDKEKIRQWKQEIEDLKEQLQELEEQRIESLGGFGSEVNYKSAAEEFANAWFNAYQEVGNGISGLEDTFDEFINNVVKKQLLIQGSNKLLDPILKMIDKAVNDGTVTTQEMADINHKWNNDTKEALNEYYKSIYDMYDGMISGTGELSDLQRGIQSITEPQATAIEAYLNSLRFFVSDSNTTLKNIYNSLNMKVDSPMLSELKAQTALIRTIDENLSAVIGRGNSTHTGAYLKVLAK